MAQGQDYHIDLNGHKILLGTDDGNKKREDILACYLLMHG
jgi:hypothetical protein